MILTLMSVKMVRMVFVKEGHVQTILEVSSVIVVTLDMKVGGKNSIFAMIIIFIFIRIINISL